MSHNVQLTPNPHKSECPHEAGIFGVVARGSHILPPGAVSGDTVQRAECFEVYLVGNRWHCHHVSGWYFMQIVNATFAAIEVETPSEFMFLKHNSEGTVMSNSKDEYLTNNIKMFAVSKRIERKHIRFYY